MGKNQMDMSHSTRETGSIIRHGETDELTLEDPGTQRAIRNVIIIYAGRPRRSPFSYFGDYPGLGVRVASRGSPVIRITALH
jgi:hypothetical protein